MKFMKFFLVFHLLWVSCFAYADDVEALARRLSDFHTMRADFSQTIYDENHQVIQKNSGTMALSRPGKFRWDIKQPDPQLLVTEGHYLWIYDKSLSQATRQRLKINKVSSPASLLSGSLTDLEARFSVTQTDVDHFKLVPKKSGDLFKFIVLGFDSKSLASMELVDNLGSLSTFAFSNVEINPALDAALFSFKPPQGVDVVHQ